MKSEEWKTYRTRFLVNAKQLTSSLSFVDHLGRQHCGRKGDYLVESSDGVISITPRHIFEDVYVPMPPSNIPSESPRTEISETVLGTPKFRQTSGDLARNDLPKNDIPRFENLHMAQAQVKLRKSVTRERRATDRNLHRNVIPRTMKLPASVENRPSPVVVDAAQRHSFA
jgi:hypothetical protein